MSSEDWIDLAGIQHYLFCPRQWGLIHIEQIWKDNILTAEGNILHEQADNPFYRQSNNNQIAIRRMHVASEAMGVSGICDIVELYPSTDKGITLKNYSGIWTPYPVEYKRGTTKQGVYDIAQLTAQIMCLEEMYNLELKEGALFYAAKRRRDNVVISDEMRELVKQTYSDMHRLLSDGIIPKSQLSKKCDRCSLIDVCLPNYTHGKSVATYLKKNLYENIT